MTQHDVVSREVWLAARRQHLEKEKELTRLRDRLSRERRQLPWVRVESDYLFEGPSGRETLAALFEGRSQLMEFVPDQRLSYADTAGGIPLWR